MTAGKEAMNWMRSFVKVAAFGQIGGAGAVFSLQWKKDYCSAEFLSLHYRFATKISKNKVEK